MSEYKLIQEAVIEGGEEAVIAEVQSALDEKEAPENILNQEKEKVHILNI